MSNDKLKKKSKKIEAYFEQKRRVKRRKKIVFLTLVSVAITGVVLCKAPFFNIKSIKVTGNKMIKKEGIINDKAVLGSNIFLLDTNKIKDLVLKNPYIKSATIKRVVPSTLNIQVEERKMFYKIKADSKIYVLNNELYIMEILDDDKNLSLVEIEGLPIENIRIGEKISNNEEVNKILYDIATSLIDKNKESIFTSVDVTKKNDISIFTEGVEIVLGRASELDEKYKKAMEILSSSKVNVEGGYIDVSVVIQPVIKGVTKESENPSDNVNDASMNENLENTSENENSVITNESIEEETNVVE